MNYPLAGWQGKRVLVTGATSGIGKCCAEAFLQAGAEVIATGRRENLLQELEAAHPGKVTPLTLDISHRSEVQKAFSHLPAPDVLVNNAGLALGLDRADRCSLDDWETMVQTNINGVLYATHTLLPKMLEAGRGHIINIGSIAGNYFYPGGNVYGGTKAFIKQFSLNLRADLIGTPIRVTNIEPGMVETDFSSVRFKGDRERAAGVYENTQALLPEDIAQSVFWAASLPEHVNINRIELMPVAQASAPLAVSRRTS